MAKRLLIADDSALIRRMIAEVLTQSGWQVVGEAGNGAEAVEKYKQLRPDAVTLDIVMPETDGLYALDGILAFDPNARVVVVSALNQTKLITEAIRKGAYDFIAKPFLPEQLLDTVNATQGAPVGAT